MKVALYKTLDPNRELHCRLAYEGDSWANVRIVAFDDEVCDRIADIIGDLFSEDYVAITRKSPVYFGGVPAMIDVWVDDDYCTAYEFVGKLAERTSEKSDIVYAETKSIEF